MNWKEFFKPTKGKIIVAIILILISFFLLFLVLANTRTCKLGAECSVSYTASVSFIILMIIAAWPFLLAWKVENLLFQKADWITSFKDAVFILGAIILSLFYIYVLACLIVVIYNRIKRVS